MNTKVSLSGKILLGLLLGVLVGTALNLFFPTTVPTIDTYVLTPVGDGFLRLIQFVVVPLVFCSLILALTSLQGTGRVGRYAGRLVLLYVVSSPAIHPHPTRWCTGSATTPRWAFWVRQQGSFWGGPEATPTSRKKHSGERSKKFSQRLTEPICRSSPIWTSGTQPR